MSTTIRRGRAPDDILAVLDVGTFKVACFIAARGRDGGEPAGPGGSAVPARVLGFGHQRARGLKAGVVVDLAEAEACIRDAIAQAQRIAGLDIEKVVLSISCGRLSSLNFRADARLGSHPVNEADIGRLMAAGQSFAERDGRTREALGGREEVRHVRRRGRRARLADCRHPRSPGTGHTHRCTD